jgi:tetratricopeptide (TPR) repeat protein
MDRHLTTAASAPPSRSRSLSLSPSASIASLVAQAADEFLEQLARGEVPDVADYVRRYPEVGGVLPQVLPALQWLQALTPADQGLVPVAKDPVEALGEFRLVREIGRGGMGIVYEAEQLSLSRRVALKVLPVTTGLDAKQLARFRIEAQVMAALHHPHIVPIFAVGCDRGVHYYAMQLIEGRSLADRLREPGAPGRFAPREAARLAMQAAEALEHAHGLGVLHRDVKPGNLLVDGPGHLWVSDFGLARLQGRDDLTESGDRLGTLRYMSPEQASGGRVLDPRTDVYALGATLYELLTARPSFDGVDRHDLLRRIAHFDPIPPRKIDPSIPRDLETIVGKAMAKEPERRYATARELADDLGRFLGDRPIRARRPGVAERLARWSQRHRRASVIAAGILVVATLAAAGGMARLWEEQQRTRAAVIAAQQARSRERQALLFTFLAGDEIAGQALAKIVAPGVGQTPSALRRDQVFCRKALAYYEEIAGRYRDDAEMQSIVAAADHRIGFIRTILKEPQADEAYRQSIVLYQGLLVASPGSRELRVALALTYGDLLILLETTGSPASRSDCLERLVSLRESLVADFPAEPDYLISLTYFQAELVSLLESSGQTGKAEPIRRRLRDNLPRVTRCGAVDADVLNSLAWMLVSRGSGTPSQDAAALAVELATLAVAQAPDLGAYWNTLGVAQYRAGDAKAAVAALQESLRLRTGGDPYDWLFLAMARHRLGDRTTSRCWYDRSLAWISANPTRSAEFLRFRDEAARILDPRNPPAGTEAHSIK